MGSAPPRSVHPRRQARRSVPVRSAPPRSVLPRRQARRSVPVRLLSDPERSDPSRRPSSGRTNGRLGMGRRVVSGLRPQKTARLLQQRYRASSSPTEFWTKTAALNPLVYASSTLSLTECSSALHVHLALDQTANHLMHRTSWYQKVMVWNSSAVRERIPAVRRPQRPPMLVSDSARVRPERPKRRKTFTGCQDGAMIWCMATPRSSSARTRAKPILAATRPSGRPRDHGEPSAGWEPVRWIAGMEREEPRATVTGLHRSAAR